MVDVVVEYPDGAPEGRVPAVPVDGLLVRFVGFLVLGDGHVRASEEIPTLSVLAVYRRIMCQDQVQGWRRVTHPLREI